nr:single-stranded DNA-binding protein [Micropruina sp.]
QARTSANGNAFAVAKVKADDKNGAWVWVSVIAFGAESERLLELKAGDAVSIAGRAELNVWADRDGNHHPGLSLVADEVAALRGRTKPRSGGGSSHPPRQRSERPPDPVEPDIPFDDPLPEFCP